MAAGWSHYQPIIFINIVEFLHDVKIIGLHSRLLKLNTTQLFWPKVVSSSSTSGTSSSKTTSSSATLALAVALVASEIGIVFGAYSFL
jgi:hypothetical protein